MLIPGMHNFMYTNSGEARDRPMSGDQGSHWIFHPPISSLNERITVIHVFSKMLFRVVHYFRHNLRQILPGSSFIPLLIKEMHFDSIGCGISFMYIIRSEEHTSELQSRGHLVCR